MTSPDTPHGAAVLTPEAAEIFEQPELRIEGPLKVTGRARYAADVRLPGMLWAKYYKSSVPHARIVSIDTSAARAVPGVHAVITGADIGLHRWGRYLFDYPVLAVDRVLFAGERIAAVAAETPDAAEEAAGRIVVEYDELPAIFDAEDALRDGAPILHPDPSGYHYLVGTRPSVPHLNLQGYHIDLKGERDIERVFAQADRVFEDTYTAPRQHQGYIEPHACMVLIEPDGTVRVISTNKAPFSLRHQLAVATGVPDEKIIVDSMFIGGDFGGKGASFDEFACYYLAKATGRPIKSVMTYVDELESTNPRHPLTIYLRTAVSKEGKLLAHESRAYWNGGAYGAAKPMAGLMVPAGWGALEAYNVPNTRMETFVAYTNTVPSGHMRAPGCVQVGVAGEGHIDYIAREMGIDPLEFRLRNVIRPGDTGPANEHIRNPQAVEVLEALKRETNWGEPLPPNHGRGIAIRSRHIGQGKTGVQIRLRAGGRIELVTGTPDQGSGSYTVARRVAAAVLSVDPERIDVRYGSTDDALLDPGSGASRVTHIVGQATMIGATTFKAQLEELACEMLEQPQGEVRLERDRFVAVSGEREWTFYDVAERILGARDVEAEGEFDSIAGHTLEDEADYNFYAYAIEVEVDPDTGDVRPIEAVQVLDVGTIINPIAHQGQLDGGFIYGLGNAIMEEMEVEDGRVTTLSLGEYKLPTVKDIPRLRTVLIETKIGPGPFGAKAVGEITNSGVAPAVANAVYDAIGVRVKTLPVTAERVFEALHEKQSAQ